MVELRWLVPVEGDRKLQYRQKVDVIVRAGQWDAAGIAQTANMQWSEWRDVPMVSESDPGCP